MCVLCNCTSSFNPKSINFITFSALLCQKEKIRRIVSELRNHYITLKILLFENTKRGEIKKMQNKNSDSDSSEIAKGDKRSQAKCQKCLYCKHQLLVQQLHLFYNIPKKHGELRRNVSEHKTRRNQKDKKKQRICEVVRSRHTKRHFLWVLGFVGHKCLYCNSRHQLLIQQLHPLCDTFKKTRRIKANCF